ncbi:MAG: hypothetical protein EXS16_19380 [Gemmataceae bacterium]|nr:hypothetical protein [Gemmataceae bacterium]
MNASNRIENLKAWINDSPDDAELRYMLAMEYVALGDDPQAVLSFHEVIQANPQYPPAYHQGARALQRLNRIADARELLTQGIPIAQRQGNQHAAGEMTELLHSLDL